MLVGIDKCPNLKWLVVGEAICWELRDGISALSGLEQLVVVCKDLRGLEGSRKRLLDQQLETPTLYVSHVSPEWGTVLNRMSERFPMR